MSEEKGEVKGLIVGLALGTIVGAVLGLLFAPTAGKEARSKVMGFIEEFPDKAKAFGEKVKEKLQKKEDE